MNSSILSTFIIRCHTNDRFILLPKIIQVNGASANSHWDSDFVLGTPKFDHVGVPGTPTFSMSMQTLGSDVKIEDGSPEFNRCPARPEESQCTKFEIARASYCLETL